MSKPSPSTTGKSTKTTRLGDLTSFLGALHPLHGPMIDSQTANRRLIVDYLRLVGGMDSLHRETLPVAAPEVVAELLSPGIINPAVNGLSPRLEQTLNRLLEGDSEKQVAQKLELSKHTVHIYVKMLYRRFGVNSRAELMSRHVKR